MDKELTIEQRLIDEMKCADGKWRNEGILTMHLNKGELSAGLEALKTMANNNIISFRTTRVGDFDVKEYRYIESVVVRMKRNKLSLVK